MNVFEGARRIAAVVGGVCAIGVGLAIYYTKPYVRLNYEIESPLATPARIADCNSPDEATEFIDRETRSGYGYTVELCFKAQESSDGRMLVPFKIDGQMLVMNEKYSPDVTSYTKRFARDFKPSPAELREAEELYTSTWRSNRIKGAVGIIVGLAVFWAVVWVIGWIVRGFLGIPSRQDHRVSPPARSAPEQS